MKQQRVSAGDIVAVSSVQGGRAVVLTNPGTDGRDVLIAPVYVECGPTSHTLWDVKIDAHESSIGRPLMVTLWNAREALLGDLDPAHESIAEEALGAVLDILDALEAEEEPGSGRVETSMGAALEPERVAAAQSAEVSRWQIVSEALMASKTVGEEVAPAMVTFSWDVYPTLEGLVERCPYTELAVAA